MHGVKNLVLVVGILSLAPSVRALEGPAMGNLSVAAGGAPQAEAVFQGSAVAPGVAMPAAAHDATDLKARLQARGAALKKKKGGDVPSPSDPERRNLKLVRAVGAGAAVAGLGLFGYAIAAGAAGPIGWAAALVFFGGLAAYLAHRRLNGKNDF